MQQVRKSDQGQCDEMSACSQFSNSPQFKKYLSVHPRKDCSTQETYHSIVFNPLKLSKITIAKSQQNSQVNKCPDVLFDSIRPYLDLNFNLPATKRKNTKILSIKQIKQNVLSPRPLAFSVQKERSGVKSSRKINITISKTQEEDYKERALKIKLGGAGVKSCGLQLYERSLFNSLTIRQKEN